MEYFRSTIIKGAIIGLTGFLLSGPVAVGLVEWLHPQPPWISVAVYLDHYHPVQNLPYYFGFLILAGMLVLSAGHYLYYSGTEPYIKRNLLLAFALTIVFCVLIAFNYICQTTFIHNLVANYTPNYDSLIAGFTMSNPSSFCWANEMWGYGVLGLANWLTAGYYKKRNNLIYGLLVANGVISLVSPLWTIIDVQWVSSSLGFMLFLLWNVLMIVLMVMIIPFHKGHPA